MDWLNASVEMRNGYSPLKERHIYIETQSHSPASTYTKRITHPFLDPNDQSLAASTQPKEAQTRSLVNFTITTTHLSPAKPHQGHRRTSQSHAYIHSTQTHKKTYRGQPSQRCDFFVMRIPPATNTTANASYDHQMCSATPHHDSIHA